MQFARMFVGIGAVLLVFENASAGPTTTGPQAVNVQQLGGAPVSGALPVSGSVTVTPSGASMPVSGSVTVTPSGASMPVAGTVNVGNTPKMKSVDNPAMQPYLEQQLNSAVGTANSFSFSAVPNGKTLVIEYIAGKFQFPWIAGAKILDAVCSTGPTVSGNLADFYFPLTYSSDSQAWYAGGPVRIYVQPGQFLYCVTYANSVGSSGQITISGHLVDTTP